MTSVNNKDIIRINVATWVIIAYISSVAPIIGSLIGNHRYWLILAYFLFIGIGTLRHASSRLFTN